MCPHHSSDNRYIIAHVKHCQTHIYHQTSHTIPYHHIPSHAITYHDLPLLTRRICIVLLIHFHTIVFHVWSWTLAVTVSSQAWLEDVHEEGAKLLGAQPVSKNDRRPDCFSITFWPCCICIICCIKKNIFNIFICLPLRPIVCELQDVLGFLDALLMTWY